MKLRDLLSETVFRNWTKISGKHYLGKFMKNWKALDKNNVVKFYKGDYVGFKKGSSTMDWKYSEDDMKLYSDMSDMEVGKLVNPR